MQTKNTSTAVINLQITLPHARAVVAATDILTRLGLGQIDAIPELVRMGTIPVASRAGSSRQLADLSAIQQIDALADSMKASLGFSKGASYGIGHPHVCRDAHLAWEVKKVLDKCVSEMMEPNPQFRGVNYDGLVVRYTQEPAPVASAGALDDENGNSPAMDMLIASARAQEAFWAGRMQELGSLSEEAMAVRQQNLDALQFALASVRAE